MTQIVSPGLPAKTHFYLCLALVSFKLCYLTFFITLNPSKAFNTNIKQKSRQVLKWLVLCKHFFASFVSCKFDNRKFLTLVGASFCDIIFFLSNTEYVQKLNHYQRSKIQIKLFQIILVIMSWSLVCHS